MNNTRKIEELLIGSFIVDPDNYWTVEAMVQEDCFTSEDTQKCYRAIRDRALNGKALTKDLIASDILGEACGAEPGAYLSALVHMARKEEQLVPEEYAETLRDAAIRRRLVALAEGIIKGAGDMAHRPDALLDRAAERIAELTQNADVENEHTIMSSLLTAKKMATKDGRGIAIEPCLGAVREMIGAYPPGSLTLVGANPGGGKTAFLMQQMLYTRTPSSLFELEMDNVSLVTRSVKEYTGISARQVMEGMRPDQSEVIQKAAEGFRHHPLRIVSPPRMTIQQLRSRALAHKHRYGLTFLGIDHIKLIERPSKHRVDQFEAVYLNAKDLKSLAKELNCAIVCLCQFTKTSRQREDPTPRMEDFYGGSLEEHADVMLALLNRHEWLKENPPPTTSGKKFETWQSDLDNSQNRIEIYKLKNRYGPPKGKATLAWDGSKTRFSDITYAQDDMFGDAA